MFFVDNNNGSGFGFSGDGNSNDFDDGFLGTSGSQDNNDGSFSGSTYGSQQNGYGTQTDYSGNTYGSQQNSYGTQTDYSGSTYGGQQNSYGTQTDYSGSTYGSQQNSYGAMNGTQTDYSGNTYGGQQNSYGTMNGTQNDFSGNSFNSMNNNESGYDPNAMFSDPSSSMYGNSGYNPNSTYSSFNTQMQYTTATKSGISKYIPVIAIILAVAVGIGVFFYVKYAGQKSIKEWLDTAEGQKAVNEMYQAGLNGSGFSEDDVKVFARSDDELVFLFKTQDFAYVPQEDADALQKYMEQALSSRKSLLSNEIKRLRNAYKLKPFSVVYELVTSSDQILFSVKITE